MSGRFGIVIPADHGQDLLHRRVSSIAGQRFDERLRPEQVDVVVAVNDGGRQTVEAARRLASGIEAAGMRCRVRSRTSQPLDVRLGTPRAARPRYGSSSRTSSTDIPLAS